MKKYTTITAIIAITLLTALAIYKGLNGAILSSAFVAIGGLGGFVIGKKSK